MAMPSKYELLFNAAGGDNAAFDTGQLDTREFDGVMYRVVLTGGVMPAGTTSALNGYDLDKTTVVLLQGGTPTTGVTDYAGSLGPGCTYARNAAPVVTGPVPAWLKITTPALGVGISVRIIVYGRRNHRGPDVSINAD